MRKTLFFQKKIKLFNVQFMVLHVNAQMKDNLIMFSEFSARSNAMLKPSGVYSNIRRQKPIKPSKYFSNLLSFSLLDTLRSRCTFLAMVNNLKLTNINSGRNIVVKIIKNTVEEITKPFSEIIPMTAAVTSSIKEELAIYVWLLMCDEKLDNTLPDIVQCSSREVQHGKSNKSFHIS